MQIKSNWNKKKKPNKQIHKQAGKGVKEKAEKMHTDVGTHVLAFPENPEKQNQKQ